MQNSKNETYSVSVTWIGHSTFLIKMDGMNFLTDPNFNRRVFLSRRKKPPGLKISELPEIDFIIISHDHYDHLDLPSLKNFHEVPIIVPGGLKGFMEDEGFSKVTELLWWDSLKIGEITVHSVPAKHFSGRWATFKDDTGWNGYVIKRDFTIYFAGDTGYFFGFKEIGKRFNIDLALLPIGAYRPRFFMKSKHINPEEAFRAFLDLRARYFIPMHWGTFRLSLEPLSEPPIKLRKIINEKEMEDRIFIMKVGERKVFSH